ncbi:IS110 family transposase [Neolewinella aurantiaca]|uniref:IS110 family transposase n=1 Tax=Neolewinella aurantiaca TaxID=2602767 RepID=A0A5C7FBD9_9BACT|nr:transposase [Neolewinella aurantiaca]TXF83904.1 IS110 family transposase [Neolewinella aurantiaca]
MLIFYGSRKSIQLAAAKGFKRLSRVPKGKAEEIAAALKSGIDIKDTPDFVIATIQSKVRQIKYLKEEIKTLEKVLCSSAPINTEQVDLLCSLKGMGRVTATTLLLFIEDFNRFEDAAHIASFFGVQPRIKKSGDGAYKPRVFPLIRNRRG